MSRIFRLLIILLIPLCSQAQVFRKFDTLPANYPAGLFQFFGKNVSDQNEKLIATFKLRWDSGWFGANEKAEIIALSNNLLNKKARPEPLFRDYLKILLLFKEKKHATESYTNWEKGLQSYIDNPRVSLSNISRFIVTTDSLLKSNILNSNASIAWWSNDSNFRFTFDSILYVNFGNINLSCRSRTDTITIFKTSGKMDMLTNIWHATGGTVNWERAGYLPNDLYVQLQNYFINLSRQEYYADSATLVYPAYFKTPLIGKFEDKLTFIKRPEAANYPQFVSYNKRFSVPGFFQGIDYTGGFSMEGSRLIGSGTDLEKAMVNIYRNDTLFILAQSKSFIIKKNSLFGRSCAIALYFDRDSIYHPDITLDYRNDVQEVSIYHNDNFSSQSPFIDTYHKTEISLEQMNWKKGGDVVNISMSKGSSTGRANFESAKYFNMARFEKIKGLDDIHPLALLKQFAKVYYSDEFPDTMYAEWIRKSIDIVQLQLMDLAIAGFIEYHFENNTVKLRQKLYDYLQASIGAIDYDVINLQSVVASPQNNAVFDLKTYDIKMDGVEFVHVSDAQNVQIVPTNKQITLKRDCSFQFDGQVMAGLFKFSGKNFYFDYNDFKINLQNIDSLSINYVSGYDGLGRPELTTVQNMLENMTGELQIDEPNNKSGVKSYAQYPMFRSTGKSYVYYDKPSVLGGIYKRDQFYFQLEPFTMDSLDNFSKEGLTFKGALHSAGIFNDIDQELSVQPDNSLGFVYTNESGLDAYMRDGRVHGKFHNSINLSNRGLRGKGHLSYLTSDTKSDDFIFYPDSTTCEAVEFNIAQQTTGTPYPKVHSIDDHIDWVPYEDRLMAYKKVTPFTIFNDQTNLHGDLTLRPNGLTGTGMMDMTVADLRSNLFRYKAFSYQSDTADFNLKSLNKPGYTVLTKNVNANIDYTQQKGTFRTNEDYTLVEFPENKYISYLDNFIWKMKEKELEMGVVKGGKKTHTAAIGDTLVGPRYVSVHPMQDSLSFIAPQAIYDYEQNIIKASKVQYIRVADAIIYPDSGKLVVEENAKMRVLYNAKITANYISRFYPIYKAQVEISSRNSYHANGDYDYIDENARKQVIHFRKIDVDTSLNTYGESAIAEPDSFMLSPYFAFQGNVFLFSRDTFLTFDGATLIKHDCERTKPLWLTFKSLINPKNIYIPVSPDATDINLRKIYAGIFLANDSIHIYPTFFGQRNVYNDKLLVTASGYLTYDKYSMRYKISTKERLSDASLPDNYIYLDTKTCNIGGEGMLTLGMTLGQMNLDYYGSMTYDPTKDETNVNITAAWDFMMNERSMTIMANEIDSFPNLKGVDINNSIIKKNILRNLGAERTKNYYEEIGLVGESKAYPIELKHSIVFSDLKLKWLNQLNTFRSVGPIGITSVLGTQINKYVSGTIEFSRKRTGDMMDVYLVLDNNKYYYFGYTRGSMQTLTSNESYLNEIYLMKDKARIMKVPAGKDPYIFSVSTNMKLSQFLNRIKENEEH